MRQPWPPPRPGAALELATFGSFHVGGRAVRIDDAEVRTVRLTNAGTPAPVDPNGVHWVESLYAQYVVPLHRRMPVPLLLWHGGALTGASWESTPDGREGWLPYFVRQGWTTLCCDAPERGRAGFPPVPQVFAQPPLHQPMAWAFERHRIGDGPGSWHEDPQHRRARPGTRFPLAAYDQLARQIVPRWTESDEAMLRGYIALLDHVGPCCILAHSQGCQFAFMAAEARPHLVRALVQVEPSGVGTVGSAEALRDVPVLLVYGDGTDTDARWRALKQRVGAYLEPLARCGGTVDRLNLPKLGVRGNSHMLMMDDNSDAIAAHVQAWLAQRVQAGCAVRG